MKFIQLQASTQEPIRNIMSNARATVSKVCGGIDDMNLLGNKALIIRAEIYSEKLPSLYETLSSIGIKIKSNYKPNQETLKDEFEYPITLQITSFSDKTDDRVNIPKIPG